MSNNLVSYFKLMKLVTSKGFKQFHNDIAKKWYQELQIGYNKNEKEELLVKRIVNVVNGKRYKKINILSKFIHGNKSQVKFDYKGNQIQRELGDMVLISIISDKRTRLYQRICYIQNKKGKDNKNSVSWTIDQPQLHLLNHFPQLTGVSGIIKKGKTVTFSNHSNCLGAYGLFKSPGEMIFSSAALTNSFLNGEKTLNSNKIIAPLPIGTKSVFLPSLILSKMLGLTNLMNFFNIPILENILFTQDLYDFSKNWAHVNIGEFTYMNDTIIDSSTDDIANSMLKTIGIDEFIELSDSGNVKNIIDGNSLGIMAMNIDISSED